ncbi:MAG: c-type cytochrome [Planctomycetes bacterium]|nr:c-type cytochrome [Planctomycetota bacterium]
MTRRLSGNASMTRLLALSLTLLALAPGQAADGLRLEKDARVVLLGNGLGSRMIHTGHFETELQLRHPELRLLVRDMCDEANTPSFRPHSARQNQLGFPGAEKFAMPYCDGKIAGGKGHFDTEEQWLARLKPDVLICFFGFCESFQGPAGLKNFREELDAFLKHTLAQNYNGKAPAKLALVSPTAIQDLSATMDVPNGRLQNPILASYTSVMEAVAGENGVLFVDAFKASQAWYRESKEALTADGALYNDAGYRKLAPFLCDRIFGRTPVKDESRRSAVKAAVLEKDFFWLNDFKIPNGVHAYGQRYNPFGPANYPFEIQKNREMLAIRDQALWAALEGKSIDVAALDSATVALPPVDTNFKPKASGIRFLDEKEALAAFKLPPGYKVQQWASEKDFPELEKPVQMSFDNKGRLWVACMPTYPHWKPGDPRPNDKLVILEDTKGAGKADKLTVFADHLNLPIGFEFAPEGVYLSASGGRLVLLKDRNGDDKVDETELIFEGFDDHDTHHAINAFTADPSGAIILAEGVFLRSNIETAYGPVRGTDGGFFRFQPQRRQLERHAQLPIPNPWGVTYDEWGQHFFLHTSGPDFEWMVPGSIKSRYGQANPRSPDLVDTAHKVRPTSGVEFVSSRHFPPEVQGDVLINNNIGFLGTKQHQMIDEGIGYRTKWRQDLIVSSDPNYRPVDLEFAPDGSLYIIDWHNPLIGHMQHNARDPNRDHTHGRIYRITYPALPLVKPAKVAGATIAELLENLKLPEYRARYRTQRELRAHKSAEVLPAVAKWVAGLDSKDPNAERWMLEGLWATWGQNHVDEALLRRLMDSKDYRVRAACVDVIRYNGHRLADQAELLRKSARDANGRVKLCAIVAATWMGKEAGLSIIAEAEKTAEPPDLLTKEKFIKDTYRVAKAYLNNETVEDVTVVKAPEHLKGEERRLFVKGAEIYGREGHCATCHQPDGEGLALSGFPPLTRSPWVNQDDDRLIKLTLKGMFGPLELEGKKFPGLTPMTPFGGLLSDEDVSAVLTYVRNSFGNKAPLITAEKVKQVREAVKDKVDFYSPSELLGTAPASPSRKFVKMWTLEDFKGAFDAPLSKRNFNRGKEMFTAAGCISCHNVQGQGAHVGADLSKVGDEYPGIELLRQIIDPSAKIKDDFRVVAVFLKNDDRYRGMIVKREGDVIQLAENLAEPDKTVTIKKADISRVTPSDVSPMPTGLLVTLSRDEVLDLVAYIVSLGNPKHRAFGD